MDQRTVSTVAELESIEWFINAGKRDSNQASFLDAWTEAISSCESAAWESLCRTERNALIACLAPNRRVEIEVSSVLVAQKAD